MMEFLRYSSLPEQLKENKPSQYGRRIKIQSRLEADDERLQKIRNRLSGGLNRIQEWVFLQYNRKVRFQNVRCRVV